MSLIFSAERIDPQSDNFPVLMEIIIQRLITKEIPEGKLWGKNIDKHPSILELANVIYKRLGMKISFITNGDHLAAIVPFYPNKNHIFLKEYYRGTDVLKFQDSYFKNMEREKGTVDLHKAKVGGFFSKYEHPVFLNLTALVRGYNLSAGEIVAVLLHELGHGFMSCYYSDRTDTTNQVLQAIHRAMVSQDRHKKSDYIYKELEKVNFKVSSEEMDKITNGPKLIAGLYLYKVLFRGVKSQMQNDKYAETSFEEQADGFATRFGYGHNLASALAKLQQYNMEFNTTTLVISYMIDIVFILVTMGLTIGALITGPAGAGIAFAIIDLALLYASGANNEDMTYDDAITRFVRVRLDLINQLKDSSLSKQQMKIIIDQIDVVVASMPKHGRAIKISPAMANFIFSDHRRTYNDIELEKLTEELSSNDLFLQAASLKLN